MEQATMRSYRDVESAPIPTAPQIRTTAEAALHLLAVSDQASPSNDPERTDHSVWHAEREGLDGTRFEISCTGPELPSTVPAEVIRPGEIAKHRPFFGTWRLVVKAPILVLDLYWSKGAPLRIMTLAGGDWEAELAQLARPDAGRSR